MFCASIMMKKVTSRVYTIAKERKLLCRLADHAFQQLANILVAMLFNIKNMLNLIQEIISTNVPSMFHNDKANNFTS